MAKKVRKSRKRQSKKARGRGPWLTLATILLLMSGAALLYPFIKRAFFAPLPSQVPLGMNLQELNLTTNQLPSHSLSSKDTAQPLVVVAQDLQIPWDLAFLPDGDLLVTERTGNLLRLGQDRQKIAIKGVAATGEGGLLGLALHPQFTQNHLLYLYMTTDMGGALRNRVERYRMDGDTLNERKILIDNIPAAKFHDGGRLAFGPDGLLYISTGDAGNSELAQDTASLAGKILRIRDDASLPPDNPFNNAVYSYGHRNVQGLTWDAADRLWATEHGPSGLPPNSGQDELNLIVKGHNYGWPLIKGDETQADLETAKLQSGVDDTWAPSGALFYKDSIFFAGLRGQALYQAKLKSPDAIDLVAHFREEFGRLRQVQLGPDGLFYILTSNTDGRGEPRAGDDRLLQIDPHIFE